FVQYTIFLGLLIAPVFQVVGIGTQLTEAMAGLERTRELMEVKPEDPDPRRTVALGRLRGEVVLEDVNFKYEEGKEVLHDVAFSRPDASQDRILAACRIARVDEFAETFEKKYDTVIGERGVKLSGGQKQRVSIARAILADPRILILDEATSSLDSESEALIQEGLRYLMRGRTTFV